MPAECDVPLRKGWFYHANEKPKTSNQLFDLYLKSVGRGAGLDLGLAPNTRGLLHEDDVAALKAFGDMVKQTFTTNLVRAATVTASNSRGANFNPNLILDRNKKTYWATADDVKEANFTIAFKEAITFDIISLQEYIPLGQRIDSYTVEVMVGKVWKLIASGASIGAKRLIKLNEPINTNKIRVKLSAPVCLTLGEFGLYKKAS